MPDGTRTAFGASHWGAFTAEAVDDRLVAVTPFAGDPHPAPFLRALPDAVHAECRVARPAVRRSWLEGGPGDPPGDARRRALRRGELGPGARSRRGRAREGQGGIRERGDLRQLGLGAAPAGFTTRAASSAASSTSMAASSTRSPITASARASVIVPRIVGSMSPVVGTGKHLAGHRRAHRPDGRVRGHAAEEPERQPGRPRHARGGRLAPPRRRSGGPSSSASGRSATTPGKRSRPSGIRSGPTPISR